MRARVKATGKIVEVKYSRQMGPDAVYRDLVTGEHYMDFELSFLPEDGTPDYWTRLEHQYAGMAMQGLSEKYFKEYRDYRAGFGDMDEDEAKGAMEYFANAMADVCYYFAHALVEKYKKEKEE